MTSKFVVFADISDKSNESRKRMDYFFEYMEKLAEKTKSPRVNCLLRDCADLRRYGYERCDHSDFHPEGCGWGAVSSFSGSAQPEEWPSQVQVRLFEG